MFYDASKALQDLGLPQTPIATALKDAVDWFIKYGYVQSKEWEMGRWGR
jgi:dihydroflavonol-4-reductase